MLKSYGTELCFWSQTQWSVVVQLEQICTEEIYHYPQPAFSSFSHIYLSGYNVCFPLISSLMERFMCVCVRERGHRSGHLYIDQWESTYFILRSESRTFYKQRILCKDLGISDFLRPAVTMCRSPWSKCTISLTQGSTLPSSEVVIYLWFEYSASGAYYHLFSVAEW